MVIADFIALVMVMGLLGIGGKSIFSAWKQMNEKSRHEAVEQRSMREDLRKALLSHDRKQLEDVMVLWGDKLPKEVNGLIKQRIDELFIEGNP